MNRHSIGLSMGLINTGKDSRASAKREFVKDMEYNSKTVDMLSKSYLRPF